MPGVLTRAGREFTAGQWGGALNNGEYEMTLKLFVDAESLGVNPLPGDFTEASFGGYSDRTFFIEENGSPTLDGDDYYTRLKGGAQTWDCTSAPQTIYGWYLIDNSGTLVLAYDAYDVPHVLEVGSRHTLYADVKIGQCG